MSKTYSASPRRRGSQSPNGANPHLSKLPLLPKLPLVPNFPVGNALPGEASASFSETEFREQVTSQVETWDADILISPLERGGCEADGVCSTVPAESLTGTTGIVKDSAKTLEPENSLNPLVPNFPVGNAISGEASASLSETEFREHVVSQTGVWDTDNLNSPLEKLVPPRREGARLKPGGVCQINIGLFGFGCVGQGLYDVLNHSQGLKASIGKICVKNKTKPRTIDMDHFTFNKHEVLASGEHNLIVELTSDADAALEIIGSSLAKGQSVVTAGKKVLAENFELLYRLQQQTGASLLYEAACAGSIPIIRTLEEYYDNELLSSVKGILNGSSNYILSKMEFDKLTYHDALKQAQLAGFAEADPALDVNGTDAKYKLCLLAAHAFGIIVKPSCIFNSGIQNITPFDINYAAQNNCRIKLIAGIAKYNGGYRAYVLPKFVSRESPLSNINYEFNGIEVEGVYSDKQFFVGKGAGSHPTGSAVLSDISAITYDYKYGYKKLKKRASYESPRKRGSQSTNGEINFHTHVPAEFLTAPAVLEEDSAVNAINSILVGEGRDRPATEDPNFSQDHRFLESDFTLRLYIRYQGNSHDSLALLDITSVEEEYTSAKGNYIIANVGFKSLFNLLDKPNDLFVCGFLPY